MNTNDSVVIRHDWTVAEIEAVYTLPLPELIFRAQAAHRACHQPDEIQGCQLLSIGALVPRKGHDVLLRALGRLPDLDWRLIIVGRDDRDPAYAAMLHALAAELGIAARVRFAGEVSGEALEALWQASDIFALATWYEGYGMAAAEALARGIPLALTAGGAIADLAQPGWSVVSKPGEHALLSKALRRMIFDGEQRARMKDAAWQAGRNLPEWPAQAEKFAAALAA